MDYPDGTLARFGFRRSIRLDPAYWMTLLIEIMLIYFGLALFPSLDTPIPDLPTIISHLFYAQDLLGYGNIVSIFWTLCYEFQFYIVLVVALVFATFVGNLFQRPIITKFIIAIGGTTAFIWSLAIFFGSTANPLPGLFINRWWQFFLGCLLTIHILKIAPRLCFFSGVIALLIAILLDTNSGIDNGLATLLIVSVVYAAAKTKGMEKWLASSLPQFLGKLSYSIYLLHAVIGWRFIKLLHELNGAEFSPWQAWLALIAGVAVSIISAWIMHWLIEAPSHRFSRTIKLPVNA